MNTEQTWSPQQEASALENALRTDFDALQLALRDETNRPAPDLSRVRGLRDALASTRAKLSAALGEPPPHTD